MNLKKNEQKQRNSLINEYRIENVKLDGTNDLDLFGIKFKGKCEIGSIILNDLIHINYF